MQSKLNVKYLMSKNNKSQYWLEKKLETDSRFAKKLIENKTGSISFKMIDKLCDAFDCTIGELIIRKETE